ncbi:MAG: DNA polymerase III subunit delta [Gemmatimonadota bacterium]|nr:DNA polymerase III subunit delta [Gemmatimonadota bacterium]
MAASLSFDTAHRRIRQGEIAPVYYLTGAEYILKDDLVSLLVEHVVDPGTRDFNVDVRQASDLDGESFHALVETPPMMADRRLVVVRSIEQWRKNSKVWQVVERYLDRPSPTTVLVLVLGAEAKVQAGIARLAAHVKVDPLPPDRLGKWVAVRAKRAGVQLAPRALEHLLEVVGNDLAQLGMELEKLAAAGVAGTVDAETVEQFVGVRRGETGTDWVAAVLSRDAAKATEMLPVVLSASGVNGVRLLSAMGTALVGLRIARRALDKGTSKRTVRDDLERQVRAARLFSLPNWKAAATTWAGAAEGWSADEIDDAIEAAAAADRALKSTTIADEASILTDFVLTTSIRKVAA